MAELFEMVASWRSLLFVVVVFGFAPGFLLRLLVKIYPKNDPRRQELVAQLYLLGRLERLLYVGEQLETVLFEGVPARARALRRRFRRAGKRSHSRNPRTLKATGTLAMAIAMGSWGMLSIGSELIGNHAGEAAFGQTVGAYVLLGAMLLVPLALAIGLVQYLRYRRQEAGRSRDRAV
jgi:hypothetical protein